MTPQLLGDNGLATVCAAEVKQDIGNDLLCDLESKDIKEGPGLILFKAVS